jgi:hypothetical protein
MAYQVLGSEPRATGHKDAGSIFRAESGVVFIETFRIERGYELLRCDASFEPMAKVACGLLLKS